MNSLDAGVTLPLTERTNRDKEIKSTKRKMTTTVMSDLQGLLVKLSQTRKALSVLTGKVYKKILKNYLPDKDERALAMAAIDMGLCNPIHKYGTCLEIDFDKYMPTVHIIGDSEEQYQEKRKKVAARYVKALRLAYAEFNSARLEYDLELRK